jgi:hypothetical protein
MLAAYLVGTYMQLHFVRPTGLDADHHCQGGIQAEDTRLAVLMELKIHVLSIG